MPKTTQQRIAEPGLSRCLHIPHSPSDFQGPHGQRKTLCPQVLLSQLRISQTGSIPHGASQQELSEPNTPPGFPVTPQSASSPPLRGRRLSGLGIFALRRGGPPRPLLCGLPVRLGFRASSQLPTGCGLSPLIHEGSRDPSRQAIRPEPEAGGSTGVQTQVYCQPCSSPSCLVLLYPVESPSAWET